MISRKDWRDAIRASGLPASRRQVLDAMADFWPAATTRPVLWASQAEISARTGLSPATVKRAWRDGEDAGFLVLVERHRQHRAPATRPPSHPPRPVTLTALNLWITTSRPVTLTGLNQRSKTPDRSPCTPRPVWVTAESRRTQNTTTKRRHPHPSPPPHSRWWWWRRSLRPSPGPSGAGSSPTPSAAPRTPAGPRAPPGRGPPARLVPRRCRRRRRVGPRHRRHPTACTRRPRVRQLCDVHDVHHTGVCPVCRADQLADPRPLGERLAARAGAG